MGLEDVDCRLLHGDPRELDIEDAHNQLGEVVRDLVGICANPNYRKSG
jgi:hypothetical protein